MTALPAARPGAGTKGARVLYRTAKEAPWDAARWPNFTPQELACKCAGQFANGCRGEYFHDPAFLDALQRLRDLVGRPLITNSGRRCGWRNARVGGALKSQHSEAIADDIALAGHDPVKLAQLAAVAGFTGIGFGATFLHVDMRARRTGFHYPNARDAWTERFGHDPAATFTATGKL